MKEMKLLMLEDTREDAALIQATLKRAGLHFIIKVVSTRQDYIEALDSFVPEIILSDHKLPQFTSNEALRIGRIKFPHIPFILITGTVSDEFASAIIKEGADDYLLKGNLKRLSTAIRQAVGKKQVEKERLRLASVVDATSDFVGIADMNQHILYLNKAGRAMIGFGESEDLSARQIRDFVPDSTFQIVTGKSIPEAIANGKWTGELAILSQSGKEIPVSVVVMIHMGADGLPQFLSTIARDITERIQAERQKEFDQNNLRSLINNTKDLMWSVDKELRLITFNDAFNDTISFMSGKPLVKGRDILSTQFTEDQLNRYKVYYARALSGDIFTIIDHFDYPVEVWAEISFYPIRQGNAVIGTACFSRDITERKKAEDKIRFNANLLNTVGQAVIATDNDGLVTYWNAAAEKIYGWSAAQAMRKNILELTPVLQNKEEAAGIFKEIRKGNSWNGEFQVQRKDGSIFPAFVTNSPVFDNEGKVVGIIGVSIDITERKKAEEELKKSNERFQYATQATSDIIWELNFDTRQYLVYEGKIKLYKITNLMGWELGAEGSYIVEEDREKVRQSFREARMDPSRTLWQLEYKVYSADYSILDVTNHAIFIRDEKGKAIRAIGAISDLTEKKKLEAELFERQRTEQLRITATALEAQEKERNAIGIELHDNVNQILVGTKLYLSMVKEDATNNLGLVSMSIDHIQSAIDENRKIAHVLVAPDFGTKSLLTQITALSESMLKVSGLMVEINNAHLREDKLSGPQKLAVYRIAQEQCTNIIKYAKAATVSISLLTEEKVFKMIISDDGIGMDTGKINTGIGLRNINARLSVFSGTAHINSAPGKGFSLEVSIPGVPAE